MASKGVSTLKFVGTVSLGLLTGLSYSLSTLTIPTLVNLPTAASASNAFDSLTTSAKKHLNVLSHVSQSAFVLAFLLSPRAYRHPYLLYTSLLVLGSRLVTSDRVAPYLALGSRSSGHEQHDERAHEQQQKQQQRAKAAAAAARRQKKEAAAAARARMEASYEVLGAAGSDGHSDGAASPSSAADEDAFLDASVTSAEQETVNGEQVRARVDAFLVKQAAQGVMAGLGFLLAVVGIWGDRVVPTAVAMPGLVVEV